MGWASGLQSQKLFVTGMWDQWLDFARNGEKYASRRIIRFMTPAGNWRNLRIILNYWQFDFSINNMLVTNAGSLSTSPHPAKDADNGSCLVSRERVASYAQNFTPESWLHFYIFSVLGWLKDRPIYHLMGVTSFRLQIKTSDGWKS